MLFAAALAADPSTYRAGLADPAGWVELDRKRMDIGEVVVSHKPIAGQECLAAETTARVPVERLLHFATDIESQPAWSSWEVPASVKLTPGALEFDYYQVLDNPSPVADRYWFLRAQVVRHGASASLQWDPIDPARYPDAHAAVMSRFSGAVPTRVNVGDWTFTPQGDVTQVRYRVCTDAGGNLPRWIGEIAARTTLPGNVADLVRRALQNP